MTRSNSILRSAMSVLLAMALAMGVCVPFYGAGAFAGAEIAVANEAADTVIVYGLPGVEDGTSFTQEVVMVEGGGGPGGDTAKLAPHPSRSVEIPDSVYERRVIKDTDAGVYTYYYQEKPANWDELYPTSMSQVHVAYNAIVGYEEPLAENLAPTPIYGGKVAPDEYWILFEEDGFHDGKPVLPEGAVTAEDLPAVIQRDFTGYVLEDFDYAGDRGAGYVDFYYNAPGVVKPMFAAPRPSNDTALALETPGDVAKGTSYTVIKLFDADIEGNYGDEEAPKASNLVFADGITAGLFGIEPTGDAKADAQAAAEYIGVTAIDEDGNVNMEHQPGTGLISGSYGMELAKAIVAADPSVAVEITADADAATVLNGSGYYLIVKTDDLTGDNTAASSPIFAALGAGETVITLKTEIPTMSKTIEEDSNGVYGTEADHTLNQDVNYRLTGSVAENVAAYDTYSYAFYDEWDADKMTIKTDSVKAYIVNGDEKIDVTEQATTAAAVGSLTVTFADLKTLTDAEGNAIEIAPDTAIIVEYTAYQSAGTASPEGIENTAYLEYANNPIVTDSKGTTPKVTTTDYSYALRIHKTDNATGSDLAGVEFSIKNEIDGTYLALVDGELVEQAAPYNFVTDEQGIIVLDGVDADKYTITEEKALDEYTPIEDTITVTVDATDRDTVTSNIASTSELVSAGDAEDVVALVNVKNIKQIGLPSTGAMGLALVVLIAAILAVRAVVRRRNKEEVAQVMYL